MNLKDTFEQCKNLKYPISQAEKIAKELEACRDALLAPSKSLISAVTSPALNARKELDSITAALTSFKDQLTLPYSNMLDAMTGTLTAIASSIDNLNSLSKVKSQISQSAVAASSAFEQYDAIIQAFSKAVTASEPYISLEELNQAENAIPVVQQRKHRLSFSDIITLISILFTIYASIISSRPSDQLDRIIDQNDIIISQQEELISLEQEDLELMETLDTLRDSIDLLTNEVELLREEIESSNDIFYGEGLSDLRDSKQQDADPQE